MLRKGYKALAVSVAMLMVAACTTTGTEQLTPAEKKMREQANTFNQTMAEGAIAGCVAGAIIGALLSSRNHGSGAAIGCGAGAAVGGATGYMVASAQESYASEEERLNAMISELQGDNQRLAGLIDSSRTVIASDKATIEALDKKIAAKKISSTVVKAEIAKVDGNISYLNQTVANLKTRQAEYETARNEAATANADKAKVAQMDEEISKLSKQIASLETDLDGLMARRKISRVG